MIEQLKSIKEEIYEEYKEYEKKGIFEKLNPKKYSFEELVKKGKIKFIFRRITKLPDLNKNIERILERSVKVLYPEKNIVWKSCDEIFGKKGKKNLVILPRKIDYKNFKQGYIGDCYFITCIHALSRIPQLLNFIMRLSSKDQDNTIRLIYNKKKAKKPSCF